MIGTSTDVRQLNSFLRGELAAVETYAQCIEKMEDAVLSAQLRMLQNSHRNRAAALSARVQELGGKPAQSSGTWGNVARLVEGSAMVFGESAAISALEEGEDHGLAVYRRDLEKLSPAEQLFIQVEVMPEQLRSHEILQGIERYAEGGS